MQGGSGEGVETLQKCELNGLIRKHTSESLSSTFMAGPAAHQEMALSCLEEAMELSPGLSDQLALFLMGFLWGWAGARMGTGAMKVPSSSPPWAYAHLSPNVVTAIGSVVTP